MSDAEKTIAEMRGIPTKGELEDQLRESVKVVTFRKLDGDKRVMTCTKNLAEIPEENHPKKESAPNEKTVTVWDVNAQGWRSFRYDRVDSVEEPGENDACDSVPKEQGSRHGEGS